MESEKTKAKEKKLEIFVNNRYTRIIKQCIPQQKIYLKNISHFQMHF